MSEERRMGTSKNVGRADIDLANLAYLQGMPHEFLKSDFQFILVPV